MSNIGVSRNVEITLSGPLFDGRAEEAMGQLGDTVMDRVADYAVDEIRSDVRFLAERRTGNYEQNVVVYRTADSRIVSDSWIVYGPWLEGVANRNATTTFKGYSMFRRTVQTIRSEDVIERTGDEVFREMRGEFENG